MAIDDKTEIQVQLSPEYPCLEIIAGPHAGSRFSLQMGQTTLGRAAENEVALDDSSVSRHHASIERTPNTIILSDVGSRNGTKVNGNKIAQPVPLEHEGRFKIGLYEFRLLMSDAAPAAPSQSLEAKSVSEVSNPKQEVPSLSARKVSKEEPEEMLARAESAPEPVEEELEEAISTPVRQGGRSRLLMVGLLIAALGVTAYFGKNSVLKLFHFKSKKTITRKTIERKIAKPVVEERLPPEEEAPANPEARLPEDRPAALPDVATTKPLSPVASPEEQPVFLDFSAAPLPAEVYFGDQVVGTTPLRSNTRLQVGKWYEARAVFKLPDLGETLEEKNQFTFAAGTNVIPVHFVGKMGVFKVSALPRDAQLYLEGYFEKDPYRAKPIKFSEIVYGKPIYVPFGRYVIELRKSRQLPNSQTFLDEVVYRREFFIKEDQSNYTVEVRDEDLNRFPIQIASLPIGAKVLIDEQEVGTTPFTGTFPVGEHILTLKREGYFDYSQLVKVALNTAYSTEITLKTTEAGELINKAIDLMKQERHAEALPLLVAAFAKNPVPRETAQISYLVGLSYLKQKMYPEANNYFLKAMEHPDYVAQAKLGLATLSNEQGDVAKALSLLVEVLLGTQDPKVRADAGLLFQKLSPVKSVLYITSDPVGAAIFVNGVDVKQVTPMILHDLALGAYRIEARKDGFQTTEAKANLGVSEFQPVLIKLPLVAR